MRIEGIRAQDLTNAVDRLKLMKFFPADKGAAAALTIELAKICPHRESLEWLVTTLLSKVPEWPGIQAIRGLLCTKYDAADGIDADCTIAGFRPLDFEARTYDQHMAWKAGAIPEGTTGAEIVKALAAKSDLVRFVKNGGKRA